MLVVPSFGKHCVQAVLKHCHQPFIQPHEKNTSEISAGLRQAEFLLTGGKNMETCSTSSRFLSPTNLKPAFYPADRTNLSRWS